MYVHNQTSNITFTTYLHTLSCFYIPCIRTYDNYFAKWKSSLTFMHAKAHPLFLLVNMYLPFAFS